MRNMMGCTVSGGGAGATAAVAVKTNSGRVSDGLDVKTVQAELRKQGVDLGYGDQPELKHERAANTSVVDAKPPSTSGPRSRL